MGNIQDTVDQLRPIDDTFMRKLAEERNVCQEMLQVIMDAKELRIISNKPQKDIHNIDTRSVTVDILCADENGRQFSVEVQKAEKKAMETTIMTAKSLICDGVADDVIHSATKLPLETIVALRKECNTN